MFLKSPSSWAACGTDPGLHYYERTEEKAAQCPRRAPGRTATRGEQVDLGCTLAQKTAETGSRQAGADPGCPLSPSSWGWSHLDVAHGRALARHHTWRQLQFQTKAQTVRRRGSSAASQLQSLGARLGASVPGRPFPWIAGIKGLVPDPGDTCGLGLRAPLTRDGPAPRSVLLHRGEERDQAPRLRRWKVPRAEDSPRGRPRPLRTRPASSPAASDPRITTG